MHVFANNQSNEFGASSRKGGRNKEVSALAPLHDVGDGEGTGRFLNLQIRQ